MKQKIYKGEALHPALPCRRKSMKSKINFDSSKPQPIFASRRNSHSIPPMGYIDVYHDRDSSSVTSSTYSSTCSSDIEEEQILTPSQYFLIQALKTPSSSGSSTTIYSSSTGKKQKMTSAEAAGLSLYKKALESRIKLEKTRTFTPSTKLQLEATTDFQSERRNHRYCKHRRNFGNEASEAQSWRSESTYTASRSETAGKRLYLQALESRKKIEKARKAPSPSGVQVKVATPGYSEHPTSNARIANKRSNRLYALSSQKQMEGKERRKEIMMRQSPQVTRAKRIPLSKATNMYQRGMQYLNSKENKILHLKQEQESRA